MCSLDKSKGGKGMAGIFQTSYTKIPINKVVLVDSKHKTTETVVILNFMYGWPAVFT